jgi:16S rRNA processing protein RimM
VDADALVALGRVTGVHGIRGAVKLRFYSGDLPVNLAHGNAVRLRRENGEITRFTVTEITGRGDLARLHLARVGDRNAAEALVGAELVVARRELPDPEPDTYYWADLIGLTVLTEDGGCLGQLVEILETGSNDVYRVSGRKREVLVPALASVVRRIDLNTGRMWVDLPEGL